MGACTSKPPTEPQAPLQLHPDLDSASRVMNIPVKVKEPNRIPETPVPAVIATPAKQINTTPVPTEAPEESLESIQVIVRIRPSEKQLSVVIKPPNSITITPPERAGPGNSPNPTKDAAIDYNNFDRVMDDCVTNEEFFNVTLSKVLHRCLSGENVTVMAYGQTGSGKTHTMVGYNEDPGLLSRGVSKLFNLLSEKPDVTVTITLTVLEIYGEEVHDLLAANSQAPIRLVEQNGSTTPVGVMECAVTSEIAANDAVTAAIAKRTVASTNMNATSSRSHVIVNFNIVTTTHSAANSTAPPTRKIANLAFVDLAGSERIGKTGTKHSSQTGKEGVQINMGLLSLSKVIKAFNESPNHIPYRDSKLTRVLKQSFGGNAVTLFVSNITLDPCNYHETLSTLRYSSMASNVVNKVVKNEDEVTKLHRQFAELKVLSKKMARDLDVLSPRRLKHVKKEELKALLGTGSVRSPARSPRARKLSPPKTPKSTKNLVDPSKSPKKSMSPLVEVDMNAVKVDLQILNKMNEMNEQLPITRNERADM
ncbi:hypothetical protein TrST_g7285 [Triparma strigata]|uniref:Kinesin motor domain-containing protein n=1 Tax=Triparma strigata TaxID=1606541 RepID=A0A9W7ALS9_9STRA|nr:hypothetical protein TrST_g7285 [Triparma strigata]